jgi:hypothetical protein
MAQPKSILCAAGLFILMSACARFPGLEAGAELPISTEPVVLLPLDALLAQANGGSVDETTAADLAARAAQLRARAAAAP